MRTPLRHEPALDGLRGLAVVGVLLFHGGHLSGGFLGVDAFFVLSGFLITSLLLLEVSERGGVRLGAFWARRARRLLPALGVLLAIAAIYIATVAAPTDRASMRGDGIATLLYVANWREVAKSTDYFAAFAAPSPLLHTWSLAIEEQFYLVWPIVAWAVARWSRRPARTLLWTSLVGMVASFGLSRFWYEHDGIARAYFGTDARIGAMLAGAALGAWRTTSGGGVADGRRRAALEVAGLVAFFGLLAAWVVLDGGSEVLYRGGFAVCSLAVVVVIADVVHPRRSLLHRLLALRPLRVTGLISYGLYLYHWPVFLALDETGARRASWLGFVGLLAITVVLAALSYRWIEIPVRHGAGSPRTWAVVAPLVVAALAGGLVASAKGEALPEPDEFDGTGGVLVVGDSVAHTVFPGFVSNDLRTGLVHTPGCRLIDGQLTFESRWNTTCEWQRTWRTKVDAQRPDVVVVFMGTWDLFDVVLPGTSKPVGPGDPAWNDAWAAALGEAFDLLHERGAQIVMPTLPCVEPTAAEFDERSARDPERLAIANEVLRSVAAERSAFVSVPDLAAFLCPDAAYTRSLRGVDPVRYDGVHYTPEGAHLVIDWLRPWVIAAAGDADVGTGAAVPTVLLYAGSNGARPLAALEPRLDESDAGVRAVAVIRPGVSTCDFALRAATDIGEQHARLIVISVEDPGTTPCGTATAAAPPSERRAQLRSAYALLFKEADNVGIPVIVVARAGASEESLRAAREAAADRPGVVTFETIGPRGAAELADTVLQLLDA